MPIPANLISGNFAANLEAKDPGIVSDLKVEGEVAVTDE